MSSDPKEVFLQDCYHKYSVRLFRTVLKIVRNNEDAEEVVQDVFVALYQKLDSFKQEAQITTWIYQIAINKALDVLKKKKAKKRFAWITSLWDKDSGELLFDPTDGKTAESTMYSEQELAVVFFYINQLPERQKNAFILFELEQLSYEEITQRLEISKSSLESLLFRARQSLREKLGTYYDKYYQR
jgi:RNA polymerase sigma-70 factor (ECF subfamily)